MDNTLTRLHRSRRLLKFVPIWGLGFAPLVSIAQENSLVRVWNEQTLKAIRNDLARPPVHARNLFHVNAAMYDAWAAYDTKAQPWLLGRTVGTYTCAFPALTMPADVEEARKEALSHAVYRLLRHRFLNSPGYGVTYGRLDHLMDSLGYDRTFTGTDPTAGGAAALGNYIAQQYIAFGRQDGSNENGNYANQYYAPVNTGLPMMLPGNPAMNDPNRWQPVTLPNSIDQAGNPLSSTPPFVGAEWGNVVPFSLGDAQGDTYSRDGHDWRVYLDPGAPAQLDMATPDGMNSPFKWNHLMVSIWQSHLDPSQDVQWDISPGTRGNNTSYPTTQAEYESFYDLYGGGDSSPGHAVNPVTGLPYAPNPVDRGNYARVLAEFWADGVDSETPPGHWFEILHNVMDLPAFERRWMGQGELMDTLEYDVKIHFALGCAMHDAAITAWGIKGYYDSVRPVSAIRYMGDLGQCTDPLLPRYHPAGVPLIPGYIEQVLPGDPLEGPNQEHLNKIKLYTYRGPSYITAPATDVAGVGWILSEQFWTYQRPTFVTPPFAGFISGHSTFSRTAAEVLTAVTGSPYFPGGMIEYVIPQNEFLVFEDGPDEEVRLQWATYRDASDACSLSRIWGGIHPAMDDIPGRKIGMELGPLVVDVANQLFQAGPARVIQSDISHTILGPAQAGVPFTLTLQFDRAMDPTSVFTMNCPQDDPFGTACMAPIQYVWIAPDRVQMRSSLLPGVFDLADINMVITNATDENGQTMAPFALTRPFRIDTRQPIITTVGSDQDIYARADIGNSSITLRILFDEPCESGIPPTIALSGTPDPATFLALNFGASAWVSDQEFHAVYDLLDVTTEAPLINVAVSGTADPAGNIQEPYAGDGVFAVDTRRPLTTDVSVESALLTISDVGSIAQVITLTFDEAMDESYEPTLSFTGADPLATALEHVTGLSDWDDDHTCLVTFSLANTNEEFTDLEVLVDGFRDAAGNTIDAVTFADLFSIDTKRPSVLSATPSTMMVTDAQAGQDGLLVQVAFSEPMDQSVTPLVQPSGEASLAGTFLYSPGTSSWLSNTLFEAAFDVTDAGVEVQDVGFNVGIAQDAAGNSTLPGSAVATTLSVDTRNPLLQTLTADPSAVTDSDLGASGLTLHATFDEPMDQTVAPTITFGPGSGFDGVFILDGAASQWSTSTLYESVYGVQAAVIDEESVPCQIAGAHDAAGNPMASLTVADVLSVQLSGVGIDEANALVPPTFLPNPLPSGSSLYVNSDRPLGANDLTVMDTQGHIVLRTRVALFGTGPQPIALPELAAGIYEVVLDGAHRFSTRILIVQP